MKKNTITLKQSELIELITETIIKIQEQSKDRITSQEQFLEVIKNIEKLYAPKDGNPTKEYKKWKKKVVTELVKEQDEWPDPGSKVDINTQINDLAKTNSTSSPQSFVDYWFNKCNHPVYGPVKALYNNTKQAIKCYDSMTTVARNYKNGTQRQEIAILWNEKVKGILATISDDLIPKMSSYGDTSNFTDEEKEIYKKYSIWVNELYNQANREELTLAESHWYHYVVDAISFIAYLACGITAGVGCVVSVVADICNALLYIYTKDDYYMAGLQLAFAVVPAGEALKYEAQFLREPLTAIFKAFWTQTKIDAKIISKEIAKLTPSELKLARKVFPKELGRKISVNYKAALVTAKGYYTAVPGLKAMMTVAGVLLRALALFIEMIWYDPEFTGGLLKLGGEFIGIEKLKSWGEVMEDWPKYGVKVANKFYESMEIGGIRALVTTSIADCNNTVYTWEHVTEEWTAENNLELFDEDEFEAAWWNGWRPTAQIEGGASGPRNLPASGDTEAWEVLKNKRAMYTQYAAMKGCKKMTEGATYGPWLTSCSKFESMYNALNDQEKFDMLIYFLSAKEEEEC